MSKHKIGALRKDSDCTDEWLSVALGRKVHNVRCKVIGVGESSKNLRATYLEGGQPRSVVLKVPHDDPQVTKNSIEGGSYEREVKFYRTFGNQFDSVPSHYNSFLDADGYFTIVMQDYPDCWQVDNSKGGCDFEESQVALRALARAQGPSMGDWMWAGKQKWLQTPPIYNAALYRKNYPTFKTKYGHVIPEEGWPVLDWFYDNCEDWQHYKTSPLGLLHGDFRADNLLLTKQGMVIIDWATVSWGPVFRDIAYFLGGSVSVETRRKHGKKLFDIYLKELRANSQMSVSDETAWNSYVRESFYPICLVVSAAIALNLSGRGVELLRFMITQALSQVIDLNAVEITKEALRIAKEPLQPAPTDDHLHPVAPGLWFNESHYLDIASSDGKTVIYVRYGRLPNQNRSQFMAAILREGQPTLQIELEDAPLPKADNVVAEFKHPRCWFKLTLAKPLEKARVQLKARVDAYEDVSKAWWGEASLGKVDIEFDFELNQAGIPYMWRITPRWEMPVDGHGTYKINGEEFEIKGPGQRDHSWGMRDWWSVSWAWAWLRLDDGTSIHVWNEHDFNTFSVGYVQKDGKMTETSLITVEEDWDSKGCVKTATVKLQPTNLTIHLSPTAHSAHQFAGERGKLLQYPRSLVRATTDDGRSGIGVIEWGLLRSRGLPDGSVKAKL